MVTSADEIFNPKCTISKDFMIYQASVVIKRCHEVFSQPNFGLIYQ